MVRETSDGGRWTLPGGWADGNRTAAQNAVKEALEESGFEVEPLKLAAVWDRTKQGHTPHVFSCCKFFFVCALIGGRATTSHEISEVGWFHEANIPADSSLERVLPQEIGRMFAHRRDPSLPTDFDRARRQRIPPGYSRLRRWLAGHDPATDRSVAAAHRFRNPPNWSTMTGGFAARHRSRKSATFGAYRARPMSKRTDKNSRLPPQRAGPRSSLKLSRSAC
jgi:ADP-ribose pyrophosphatase YjhB (NUDIX family)